MGYKQGNDEEQERRGKIKKLIQRGIFFKQNYN
jgi:hypothetical protein